MKCKLGNLTRRSEMLPSVVEVTPRTKSDYLMEVIKGMKNNVAVGTDNLQAEGLKHGANEIKKKTK
jgi:hypothetical protein